MSYLRSSQNYIWNTSAVLGKGATGAVYAGLHKATGESVAVKSFNHLSHMRPYEVQKREFEVLKKVNHENIVRLLAIEEEVESQHKVLVMELCTGGSLFNILDDPVNCYGLEETEFLFVLKHLAAGMKHLRDNNIMHRDLKPGNIMKFICEDGSSIYKLTDFGAARELEDDQQFMSLYGTEEYLHPDMYERAVLRKSAGKSFKANFDLWSIGVTLYHIATGSLPFKPYGGRKNKETMYKITTEKSSGIISGIQHSENGEIEWSKNLPKTCLLSNACANLVTKLLAGLMECQPSKMWSFEQFFDSVTFIQCHKVFHVFYVNSMKDVTIYVNTGSIERERGSGSSNGTEKGTIMLSEFKSKLKQALNISPENQLLLWNHHQVTEITNDIETTPDKPIILLNYDPIKMKSSPIMSSVAPKFPDMKLTVPVNTDADANSAKLSSQMAYSVSRIINKSVNYYILALDTPSHVISFVESNVTLLFEKSNACSHLFNSVKNQANYLNETAVKLQQLKSALVSDGIDVEDPEIKEPIREVNADLKNLNEYWVHLSKKMQSINEKVKELNEKWPRESISNPAMVSSVTKAKYFCQKIKDSWQTLHKDKSNRILSHNEEQLHQLEKIKIETNCKKLSNLLCNICYNNLSVITDKLDEWLTSSQVIIVQFDCLFKELVIFMNDCNSLSATITSLKESEFQSWNKLFQDTKIIKSRSPSCNSGMNSGDNYGGGASGGHLSNSGMASGSPNHGSGLNDRNQTSPTLINFDPKEQANNDSYSDLFLSCENLPMASIPPELGRELTKLRDAHHRLWSTFEENQALMSVFESLSFNPNPAS